MYIVFDNKMNFEKLNGSIGEVFDPENPFEAHNICVSGFRDQDPDTIIFHPWLLSKQDS